MGLLDFARDVGRRLFSNDAEAAENIKAHLEVMLSGIRNVAVTYDDGVATISGECDNQDVKNRAIMIAGDVQGVEKVVADDLIAPEPTPQEAPKEDYYTIKSGDTLGAIAQQFYGKASAYTRIFEANKDIISDPNKIYPGQTIRIPLD